MMLFRIPKLSMSGLTKHILLKTLEILASLSLRDEYLVDKSWVVSFTILKIKCTLFFFINI